MTERDATHPSALKLVLDFLWDGGFRSLIVAAVAGGAIWITLKSDRICKPYPPEAVAMSTAAGASGQKAYLVAQPNPICAKYFELAFMVVGGYLGLSTPKLARSPGSGAAAGPLAGADGAAAAPAASAGQAPPSADARLPADNPDA